MQVRNVIANAAVGTSNVTIPAVTATAVATSASTIPAVTATAVATSTTTIPASNTSTYDKFFSELCRIYGIGKLTPALWFKYANSRSNNK
jgi:hypothetical protein